MSQHREQRGAKSHLDGTEWLRREAQRQTGSAQTQQLKEDEHSSSFKLSEDVYYSPVSHTAEPLMSDLEELLSLKLQG